MSLGERTVGGFISFGVDGLHGSAIAAVIPLNFYVPRWVPVRRLGSRRHATPGESSPACGGTVAVVHYCNLVPFRRGGTWSRIEVEVNGALRRRRRDPAHGAGLNETMSR
jgi:hypothetical protein